MMAESDDVLVKVIAARDANASAETLIELSRDLHPSVRLRAVKNPNLPDWRVKEMIDDPWPSVRLTTVHRITNGDILGWALDQ